MLEPRHEPGTASERSTSCDEPVVQLVDIRPEPLSVDEVIDAVRDDASGGLALFLGVIRDHDEGDAVTALDYVSHPSAPETLREVAEQVAADEDVRAVAVVHRVGGLHIGDLAVVVAVAAPHRAEAFAGCRRLIDELKERVPIWKHQTFVDGATEWVGAP